MGQRNARINQNLFPYRCADFVAADRLFTGSFAPAAFVRGPNVAGVERSFVCESVEQAVGLGDTLHALAAAAHPGHVRPLAAMLRDGGFCGVTIIDVVLEHFEDTVADLLARERFKPLLHSEAAVWRFIFDVGEALAEEKTNDANGGFVHPLSVVARPSGGWALLHYRFFAEDGLSRARAGIRPYFASPELFAQTLETGRRPYLVDNDASNVFSLALLALWMALPARRESIAALYAPLNAAFDVDGLKNIIDGLSETFFSPLLSRVLADMTEERVYRRIASSRLFALLGAHRGLLGDERFSAHSQILESYEADKRAEDEKSILAKLDAAYDGNFDQSQTYSSGGRPSDAYLARLLRITAPVGTRRDICR